MGSTNTAIPGFVTTPPRVSGDQLNPVIYNVPLTPGVADIGPKMLAIAPATGTYRLTLTASLTAAGVSCGDVSTVAVSLIYTDPATGAVEQTVAVGTFSTDGTDGTAGNVALSSGVASITFRAKVNTPISISTVYTAGASCDPGPTVQLTPILESLGQ